MRLTASEALQHEWFAKDLVILNNTLHINDMLSKIKKMSDMVLDSIASSYQMGENNF